MRQLTLQVPQLWSCSRSNVLLLEHLQLDSRILSCAKCSHWNSRPPDPCLVSGFLTSLTFTPGSSKGPLADFCFHYVIEWNLCFHHNTKWDVAVFHCMSFWGTQSRDGPKSWCESITGFQKLGSWVVVESGISVQAHSSSFTPESQG